MTKLSKINPARTLIFLDIDGTILAENQRTNAAGLPAAILHLTKKGFRFGLNSNRALEDVLPIIRRFHLTGPFVLENGAYVLPRPGGKKILNKKIRPDTADRIRQALEQAAAQMPGLKLVYADTVRLIKKGKWQKGTILYANNRRKFSASVHHRISGRHDFAFAQKLARALNSSLAARSYALQATANRHGSTVTVSPRGISKKEGLRQINRIYPGHRLIAIGDGEGDVDLRQGIDELYAVSNATPVLKRIADRVAKRPLTAGVLEILKTIEERST